MKRIVSAGSGVSGGEEVRYAWDNDPATAFRNKAGYPMSPFCWKK